jgi:alanine dehydrogenase
MNQGQAPTVLVLGYGNVSMGAFELFRNEGVDFTILGRAQTSKQALPAWLAGAQLIVNGAETPGDTEYIITQQNSDHDIAPGSVVIDLIGGSPYLRSPVEHFQWTTFLTEIHHEYNGHYYAGLWGWDMFYSMTDTAAEYSRRIKDVLTGNRGYAGDLDRFFTEHAYAAQLGL